VSNVDNPVVVIFVMYFYLVLEKSVVAVGLAFCIMMLLVFKAPVCVP